MSSIQKKALKLQEKELTCQIIAFNENVTLKRFHLKIYVTEHRHEPK